MVPGIYAGTADYRSALDNVCTADLRYEWIILCPNSSHSSTVLPGGFFSQPGLG
jgi:hypothetical protein